MKKLFALLARAPRLTGVLAVVAAVLTVSAATFAWGPDRPDVDAAKGADHVVFNSMTNNPNYGNERQFITVQDPTTGKYGNDVKAEPGKEYMVRVLVHNDGNTKAHPDKDLRALNTTLRTVVSSKTGTKNAITAYVDADNATPKSVHADIFFNSDQEFNLAYINGSARVYNNGYAAGGEGKAFSDSFVTQQGAKLGYEKEGDGVIPGCFEYINYVYFKVRPQFAPSTDFTVQKKVSQADKNKWNETYAATPGETVDWRVEYKNTGGIENRDVVVKDVLPKGVNYIPGSTKLYTSLLPNGKTLSDNIVSSNGVNIGHFGPNANAFVVFKTKVAANDSLEKCELNTLINKASVETDYGHKTDNANVTVTKKCEEPPVKIKVCELTTKKVITINEKDFDSKKHSKNLDDCKEVVVKIEVCELGTKKIVTINEKDFDSKKHSKNLDDCKEVVVKIEVCELSTKEVITIDKKDFDSKKHSTNLDDCKEAPVVPETIEVCELDTKKTVTINKEDFDSAKHSKNLDDCTVTPPAPEVPTELPQTGTTSNLLTFLSAGSLVAAIGYYAASRRI